MTYIESAKQMECKQNMPQTTLGCSNVFVHFKLHISITNIELSVNVHLGLKRLEPQMFSNEKKNECLKYSTVGRTTLCL